MDELTKTLQEIIGEEQLALQPTRDGIPTYWVPPRDIPKALRFLKEEISQPYSMLYDLFAIDERAKVHRQGQELDFTVVYHLLSFERNADIRIKTALRDGGRGLPSISGLWAKANWYER